jgi:hypothetical protein
MEQADVALKDARAEQWCKDASGLTGVSWAYLKIKYQDYMILSKGLSRMPVSHFRDFIKMLGDLRDNKQMGLDLDI